MTTGSGHNNNPKTDPHISVKIRDEELFRFNQKTGVLYVSMSEQSIAFLIQKYKKLPIAKLPLRDRENNVHEFVNVKEIRPLPRKDGTFFMSIQKKPLSNVPSTTKKIPAKRGWFRRLLGF